MKTVALIAFGMICSVGVASATPSKATIKATETFATNASAKLKSAGVRATVRMNANRDFVHILVAKKNLGSAFKLVSGKTAKFPAWKQAQGSKAHGVGFEVETRAWDNRPMPID